MWTSGEYSFKSIGKPMNETTKGMGGDAVVRRTSEGRLWKYSCTYGSKIEKRKRVDVISGVSTKTFGGGRARPRRTIVVFFFLEKTHNVD